MKYIKLNNCVNRGLYSIDARNFIYGVYNKAVKGFIGIRTKFKYVYLATEFHWDTGPPYGTVKPLKLIEICPLKDISEGSVQNKKYIQNKKLFEYLKGVKV